MRCFYQQARVRLGLDKPIPVQYLSWMGNILQGDFGYSTVYRIPVKELIGPPMKNTIALNVVYYIFLFAIGIPLGIKCAVKKDTVFDTSLQVANYDRYQYSFIYFGADLYLPVCN